MATKTGLLSLARHCGCRRRPVTPFEAKRRGLGDNPPTPKVPPEDLKKLPPSMQKGLAGSELNDGIDAVTGLDKLPGQRFGKTQFDIPNRPILNPSWKMPRRDIDTMLRQSVEREATRLIGKGAPRIEKGALLAEDGTVLYSRIAGKKNSISLAHIPDDELRNATFIHVHPKGGPLSDTDLVNSAAADLRQIVSVGRMRNKKVMLHRVSRPVGGWPDAETIQETLDRELMPTLSSGAVQDAAMQQAIDGAIDYDDIQRVAETIAMQGIATRLGMVYDLGEVIEP